LLHASATSKGPVSEARPDRSDGVLGTDGVAIMGGLLVATILTLIFLPTIYVAWFGGAFFAESKA
jgi:hypothetical protein